MKNYLKIMVAIVASLATLFLISCGANSLDSTEKQLSTGISSNTKSTEFGKPASSEQVAAMSEKIGGYFNGQYASNPKALMGAQAVTNGTTSISPQVLATSGALNPVFRFYNSNTSAHFYTMSVAERDYIQQTYPFFSLETTAFFASSNADPALSPVYRFYNKISATHFYTISEDEKNHVLATWPEIFNYENIAWYASTVGGGGWTPMYRFFNLHTGTHFYTASAAEKDHIIATWDWFRPEGIAYYVQPSDPYVSGDALTLATSLLAAYDASLAIPGPIPASGASALVLTDGCQLTNGYSKAMVIADYDADPLRVASRQFEIGSTRTGITVLADRLSTNTDGTGHREIDVQYTINYIDGTKDEATVTTLIQGSSYGAKLADGSVCSTPDRQPTLRFYGNRKVAQTFVNASNEHADKFLLSTGLAKPTAVLYNKYISLGVRDPANVITYATVSGPGIVTTTGAAMTLKLVSPRLLRSAPEFAGKNGNFIDWKDTDNFRICRTSTGSYALAETADCVTNGATSNTWGSFGVAGPIDSDTNFNALGVVAGGVYTFKLYAGDGWKTINGQLGVMPVATYNNTLDNLPMSSVALAGTLAVPNNKFAVPSSTTLPWQIATAIRNKAAIAVPLVWALPGTMPDARPLALTALYSFENGSTTAAGFYPATRLSTVTYPASTASAASSYTVPAPVAAMLTPSYAEITLEYSNRNGNFVRTLQTYD